MSLENFFENLVKEDQDKEQKTKYQEKQIENTKQKEYLQQKLIEQRKMIDDFKNIDVGALICGSWALMNKTIGDKKALGDDYVPNDVDIFIDKSKWDKFLNDNPDFFQKKELKMLETQEGGIHLNKHLATADIHFVNETPDEFVEERPDGIFHFPKEGFENGEMVPELMYLLEKGGPNRPNKQNRLDVLEKLIDHDKLAEIDKHFRFEPKRHS